MLTLPTFWITGKLEFVRFLFESILTKWHYIESISHFAAPFLSSYLLFLNPVSLHFFSGFSFYVATLLKCMRKYSEYVKALIPYVSFYLFNHLTKNRMKHARGRTRHSNWYENSFIMVDYEKFFFNVQSEFCLRQE